MTDLTWLTARQAAERAQVSESTLLRELRAGRCRGVKVGGRRTWRLRPAWVDEWLERQSPEYAEQQQHAHLRIAR
jgi:excisionase family DNA binding protein